MIEQKGNNLTASDWRWFAATIDCEGYIGIVGRKGAGEPEVRVVVSMTSKQYIDTINNFYSGYLGIRKSSNPKWKQIYNWTLHNDNARNLLEGILPYLIIKTEQAKICLECLALRREWGGKGRIYPASIRDELENMRARVSSLNQKGNGGNLADSLHRMKHTI